MSESWLVNFPSLRCGKAELWLVGFPHFSTLYHNFAGCSPKFTREITRMSSYFLRNFIIISLEYRIGAP